MHTTDSWQKNVIRSLPPTPEKDQKWKLKEGAFLVLHLMRHTKVGWRSINSEHMIFLEDTDEMFRNVIIAAESILTEESGNRQWRNFYAQYVDKNGLLSQQGMTLALHESLQSLQALAGSGQYYVRMYSMMQMDFLALYKRRKWYFDSKQRQTILSFYSASEHKVLDPMKSVAQGLEILASRL